MSERSDVVEVPHESDGSSTFAALRQEPTNPHLLRGYGPLVVAVVLVLLMAMLAPTVAPERILVRPVTTTSTAP